MKRVLITFVSVFLLFGLCYAGEKPELKDQKAKDSYSLGYQYGETFKKQGIEIDLEIFTAGIRDSLGGTKPGMSPEEIRETLSSLQKRVFITQQQQLKEKAARNLGEGKAFLAENAKKEGVKTLPSGLQYRVITEGTGPSPKIDDTVTVNYRGTLVDGTEFDSSYKRGEPASFHVDGVIAGWTEALQMMKKGSKWELFVPSELAYGERGMGRIPRNSTLIFEVELISVGEPPKK
jgi:FKBP-type peptidyl-prolyl cis-trans isomerase FklB